MSKFLYTSPSRFGRWRTSRATLVIIGLLIAAFVSRHSTKDGHTIADRLPFLKTLRKSLREREEAVKKSVPEDALIAIYDTHQFHDDIQVSYIYAATRFGPSRTLLYRQPWRFGMHRAISGFFNEPPRHPERLINDLKLHHDIRLVVQTTCDWENEKIIHGLEEAWTERPDDKKFTVACLRHWLNPAVQMDMAFFAERDSLTIYTLGDHVSEHIRDVNLDAARRMERDHAGEYSDAAIDGVKRIPVYTFPPVWPPTFPARSAEAPRNAHAPSNELSSALLTCTWWNEEHRSVNLTITTLQRLFKEDASVWGYLPLTPDRPVYEEDPKSRSTPFKLVFLGGGNPPVPPELVHVCVSEHDKQYPDFYQILNGVSLVLPALGTKYDDKAATSVTGNAAQARSPLLVTQELYDQYGYFCADSAVIRPDDVNEIEFVQQVRARKRKWPRRDKVEQKIRLCQEAWAVENMEYLAAAMNLPKIRALAAAEHAMEGDT